MSEKSSRVVTWLRNVMFYDPIQGWLLYAIALVFFLTGGTFNAPILWVPAFLALFLGILHFIPNDEDHSDDR